MAVELFIAKKENFYMLERMTILVLQLGVIVFAARAGGILFERMRMPAIIGEISAGIIIGPYLLGGISIPTLGHCMFPIYGNFPISSELYGFTTVASIILLFLVGLETDIEMFAKYSVAGSVVGVGGVLVSFLLGDAVAVLFSKYLFGIQLGFSHPICLFLGVISTATSVGITARILSEQRKLQSPEGVTIISGAVIDDILGVIALAIVIGVAKSGHIEWSKVLLIGGKSIIIWLAFTSAGLFFARDISNFLKRFKDTTTITIMALGLALIIAGIFEKAGLAMIIGAYVVGLSLSRTDLDYVIQEKLSSLHKFFVPIFFCVMGMMVDLSTLMSRNIFIFGVIYTIASILSKVIGCGFPALFLNFNLRGALRIGLGMTPRGEVALLMAGIGLSAGMLNQETLGVVVMMTMITTLITPVMLTSLLKSDASTVKKSKPKKQVSKIIVFDMPTSDTSELVLSKIVLALHNEGFYVHRLDTGARSSKLYQIRKDSVSIGMRTTDEFIEFDCKAEDVIFVNTLVYEVLCDLENTMRQLQTLTDRSSIGKKIFGKPDDRSKRKRDIAKRINSNAVEARLKGVSKQEIIEEMVDLVIRSGQLEYGKKEKVLKSILEREKTMSTGMQYGIAIPHAKTNAVKEVVCAIGIKRQGVDFQSLDGEPSKIFAMILSPRGVAGPHIRFMADISQLFMDVGCRKRLVEAEDNQQLYSILIEPTV